MTGSRCGGAPFRAALVCALGAAGAGAPRLAAAQDVLRAGESIALTQGASERREIELVVETRGEYLLRVEQGGLDLTVTLRGPDGTTEAFNSPLFRDEAEFVWLAQRASGRYVVTLACDEHSGTEARPVVELRVLPATLDAREREAWRLMTSAAAANATGGEKAWADAAAAYERAATVWNELGRPREAAQATLAVATIAFWQLYDWDRSARLAAAAARAYAALGLDSLRTSAAQLEASALVEQALAAAEIDSADGLFARATRLLEGALAARERSGDVFQQGSIVNNLGYVAYNRGAHDDARRYYERAAALLAAANEPGAELNPRANLAVLDAERGQVARAVESFERILAILPPGKLARYRGDTLFNLGTSYRMLGDIEQALRAFAEALEIQRAEDDEQGRGRSLRGLGEAYYALGELELATQYLEQALALAIETNDGRPQEGIQRTLGNIAALAQDHSVALQRHRRAFELATSITDRAYLELLMAKDSRALGQSAEAAALAASAFATAENSGSALLRAAALHELGLAASPTTANAFDDLEAAAEIYRSLGLDAEHAEVRHDLTLAARAAGRWDDARLHGAAALDAAERIRLRIATPELRAAASTARRGYYETQIDTLLAIGARASDGGLSDVRAAFDVSERGRARMVADLLAEAAVDLRTRVPPELHARQAELVGRLAELQQRRESLLRGAAEGGMDAAREALPALQRDLAAAENELNLVEIELRRDNPALAGLTGAAPLASEQVQSLLDEDTVLLQFALGEPSSHVWVVGRDAIEALELPGRGTIEAAARRVRDDLKRFNASAQARGAPPSLAALAGLVLAPVAARLDRSRVLLALDGALQYVPFAALPVATAEGGAVPLLELHEIVVVPSMSAVAALPPRSARERRPLAIVADPVLTPSDPRLTAVAAADGAAALPTLMNRTSTGVRLERLQAASYEADVLAALVPPEQRFVMRGFEANRDAVVAAPLDEYRYVHFATHGLIDSRYPSLSALAVSQYDSRGAPLDGFLRLHDIFNLRLDADVVVLSACETALGREIRGEGLVGLTQGFLYAGARGLVASLWQVPDRATAELMTRFYTHLLQDGLRPAAALRAAQNELAATRRWSDPYFWGAFVLVGDWR